MIGILGIAIVYGILGVLLGTMVRSEYYKNDVPTEDLSFWGKLKRGLLFPMSGAITGFSDYLWCERKDSWRHDGTSPKRDSLEALFLSEDSYGVVQFFIGLPTRILLVATFLLFLIMRGFLSGVKLATSSIANVPNFFSGKSARVCALSDFSAGKERIAELKEKFKRREEALDCLIAEGELLSGELGANGAAERCRALVVELKRALIQAKDATSGASGALNSLEGEEKNFKNLARLLEFYKKVAAVNAGAKNGVAETEVAMARALASCEKILSEFSFAEAEAMGHDVPIEMLEASAKDFGAERARLRSAQEKALAVL